MPLPLRRQARMQTLTEDGATGSSELCSNHACLVALKKPHELCQRCKSFVTAGDGPARISKSWDWGSPEQQQGGTREPQSPTQLTIKQRSTLVTLNELQQVQHYRCMAQLEGEVREMAADLRTTEPATAAKLYRTIGFCRFMLEEYSTALELHENDEAICSETGNLRGVGGAFSSQAMCHGEGLGDYAKAMELYEAGRAICEETGSRLGLATALGNLGVCSHAMGAYEQALSYLGEAKKIYEEFGNDAGITKACSYMVSCFEALDQLEQAAELRAAGHRPAVPEEKGNREGIDFASAPCSDMCVFFTEAASGNF